MDGKKCKSIRYQANKITQVFRIKYKLNPNWYFSQKNHFFFLKDYFYSYIFTEDYNRKNIGKHRLRVRCQGHSTNAGYIGSQITYNRKVQQDNNHKRLRTCLKSLDLIGFFWGGRGCHSCFDYLSFEPATSRPNVNIAITFYVSSSIRKETFTLFSG